ncbi:TnsA endonuclease N-terminal domain-containing protein [Metapseudomonas resinovorans]|uniref:TnsA endonuclease N-terminal domain-containing protein n=1 Tax=Metapseudomonas resinovorans TaxID=53412 RepID=UPI000D1C8F82|nr:TnsA endonuclease N-terminal domain-containing protein [Pseudomonas resinovorans]
MPSIPPARKLTKGHYGRYLVCFPSRKNACQVICESLLEADYCLHLEYAEEVVAYFAQPETMSFLVDGKTVTYTPDFLVETADRTYYTEVKPDWSKLHPAYQRKLSAAKDELNKRQVILHIADCNSINQGATIQNLKLLYFNSFNANKEELNQCMSTLCFASFPLTIQEFLKKYSASPRAVYRCIFDKHLKTDLLHKITPLSILEGAT